MPFLPPTHTASLEYSGWLISIAGQAPKQAPHTMHLLSSTITEGLPLTVVGRIAATGQRATALGSSQTLDRMSWLMRGGRVCCTTTAMSACPPQLISQQEVERRTRLGISSLMNSSNRESIMDLLTPEASVAGMSQCHQPWVWATAEMALPVPPTG